jgi:hypothetical protein
VKKLSAKQKKMHVKRILKHHRNLRRPDFKLVKFHYFEGTFEVLARATNSMPASLCLDEDPKATIEFFCSLRKRLNTRSSAFQKLPQGLGRGSPRAARSFYDFATLKHISAGAALILAAEFDRAIRINGAPPAAIDIEHWDETVFSTLFHLGFFSLMSFQKSQIQRQPLEFKSADRPIKIMPMVSDVLANATDLRDPITELLELARCPEDIGLELKGALLDAIENVIDHAYPLSINADRRIPRRWWVSGAVIGPNNKLRISLYDQGVTIWGSMSQSDNWKTTFGAFRSLFGYDLFQSKNSDRDAIRWAISNTYSSTDLSYRGKGLPKIKEKMTLIPNATLKIMSGFGLYSLVGSEERNETMEMPVLGTYVEFTVSF